MTLRSLTAEEEAAAAAAAAEAAMPRSATVETQTEQSGPQTAVVDPPRKNPLGDNATRGGADQSPKKKTKAVEIIDVNPYSTKPTIDKIYAPNVYPSPDVYTGPPPPEEPGMLSKVTPAAATSPAQPEANEKATDAREPPQRQQPCARN